MRPKSLVILGLLALFSLTAIVTIFLFSKKDNKDFLVLTSQKNKFHVGFDIPKKDEGEFTKVLGSLDLPQDLKNGFQFELDSTSSAKLSFLSPVNVNFQLQKNPIPFEGFTSYNNSSNSLKIEKIKAPSSTNLAIFAQSFKDFIKTRVSSSEQFTNWLDKNLSTGGGQYLIFFGQNPDFSIIFKSKTIDFSSLKNIQSTSPESVYKEETQDDVIFYLLKMPQSQEGRKSDISFFRLGEWVFLSSSYEAAQEMLKVQKSQESQIEPFSYIQNKPVALSIHFFNNDKNPITESFLNLLFLSQKTNIQKEKFFKILSSMKEFEFSLNQTYFSGLIYLK